MAMQEDLATLFARNLSLQQPAYIALPKEEPAPAVTPEPYVYSISRHYHHSNHLASQQPSRPASEPPQTDQLTTEIILARHGVDSSSLFPTQIDLFRTADPSQQMRLIELWRICPPNYGGHALAHDLGNWPITSLQQEEAMTKLRYERQMLEERMSRSGGDQGMDSDTMSDSSATAPLTPNQGGDRRWPNTSSAEPYMQSGYDALAQREYEASCHQQSKDVYSHYGSAVGGYNHATDLVYKSVQEIHQFPNVGSDWQKLVEQQQIAMENQYGAYDQAYHHEIGGVTVSQGEDEEML